MDIHRTRFVPYPPSAINALAFSHSTRTRNSKGEIPERDPTCLRLAIGRANGNIEIWNPARGAWIHETTLYGGKERSVEGLAWIQEPEEVDESGNITPGQLRLFSIGYTNTVTEWDLLTGLPLRHSGGNHGDVWCLAAQPPWEPRKRRKSEGPKEIDEGSWRGQNLVVGCADGTLAVLSTADNDLQFQKFLARPSQKKTRVLSVTYQNRETVVAGYANGLVGIYDTKTGAQIRNISLGAGHKGSKDILVWTVKALPRNGDIVVGDSTGEIRFYDGKNYSQLARVAAHDADVLTLAVGGHTRIAFSGSMDRRSAAYTTGDKTTSRWTKISQSRYHDHDVKAMALYEGKDMSVVVSGGLDIAPVVVPMRNFGQQYHLSLPITPQRPPIVSGPKQRLVVSWWAQEARIWQYPEGENSEQLPKLLARMGLKGDESITSASLDESGRFLALATAAASRVFEITRKEDQDTKLKKVQGLELPGARLVKLSPNGKWLLMVTHENIIKVARVLPDTESGKTKLVGRLMEFERATPEQAQKTLIPRDGLNGSWGNYSRTITQAAFSADSNVVTVGDLAGFLDTFTLQGNEDLSAAEYEIISRNSASAKDDSDDEDEDAAKVMIKGQTWVTSQNRLPRLESAPLLLSFRPPPPVNEKALSTNGNSLTSTEPHLLFIVDAFHRIYEFDVNNGKLSSWSRRNPQSSLPPEFASLKDRVMDCVWDISSNRQRIWLYGSSWLFMFDLAADLQDSLDSSLDLADKTNLDSRTALQAMQMKRRKHFRDVEEWQKDSTGAGDRVRDNEVLGMARTMRKITRNAEGNIVEEVIDATEVSKKWEEESRRKRKAAALEDDEDVMSEDIDEEMRDIPPLERDVSPDLNGSGSGSAEESKALVKSEDSEKKKSWWSTHKYRPILGIVPLQRTQKPKDEGLLSSAEDFETVPEVVLVERPLWDVDLPPKFVGAWEKGK